MIGRALDKRPAIVAIAGPNGAGKPTFFHSHLREAGLRLVNADDIALVFDNEDLAALFRKVAEFQNGKAVFVAEPLPQRLGALPAVLNQ